MLKDDRAFQIEHFVTLFDNNYLPLGLCLHNSLMEQGEPFVLWVLCMDEFVEENLRLLNLPNVRLIPLADVETKQLIDAKNMRTQVEYCWTLTPFSAQFVFERQPDAQRVTYVDADLYFFSSPRLLLDEFQQSGKDVLITEHAYSPKYENSGRAKRAGRFCVQFLTFNRTNNAEEVMRWWQDKCLDWCYARAEDGRFGDQKYLDLWPELFGEYIFITNQKERTLAPWNLLHYENERKGTLNPVFFHFHGLRIISNTKLLLYTGYRIGTAGSHLYDIYIRNLHASVLNLKKHGIQIPYMPRRNDLLGKMVALKHKLFDGEKCITFKS